MTDIDPSILAAATLSMTNLELRICRPPCYSSRATCTPVAPAADSKRHALRFARV